MLDRPPRPPTYRLIIEVFLSEQMNEPDRKKKTNEITSDMLVFREDANFHSLKTGS